MKTTFKLGFILLGLLTIVSCTTFELDGLTYSKDAPGVEVLGEFEVTVWVNEFLGGSGGANLFNLTSDAMNDPIRKAIQEEIETLSGDAAINVSVKYQASFVNILLNGITGGIYAPATAVITGTVVSYN